MDPSLMVLLHSASAAFATSAVLSLEPSSYTITSEA